MQRITALVLLMCYAALGTGAVEYWHNAQHAAEDAILMAAARDAGKPLDHAPVHDESNCPFCAQLHLARFATKWIPVLVSLGFFVAFLTLLAPRLSAQRVLLAVPCRGPPVR